MVGIREFFESITKKPEAHSAVVEKTEQQRIAYQALQLFVRASREYPATNTGQAAYIARYCIQTSDFPNPEALWLAFNTLEATEKNKLFALIKAAAKPYHEQYMKKKDGRKKHNPQMNVEKMQAVMEHDFSQAQKYFFRSKGNLEKLNIILGKHYQDTFGNMQPSDNAFLVEQKYAELANETL